MRSPVIDRLQPIDLVSVVRDLGLQTIDVLFPCIPNQVLYWFVIEFVIWHTIDIGKRTPRVLIRVVVWHFAIVITVETKVRGQHLIIIIIDVIS